MVKKRKHTELRDPNKLTLSAKKEESEADALARNVLLPMVQAAPTLRAFGEPFGQLDLLGLIRELHEQTKAVLEGDLSTGESMLAVQAHTLDSIFNNLAFKAIKSDYIESADVLLKLALRAQSQCRATWETLSTIKNPPVARYVAQANVAHNQQVINNQPPTTEAPRARKNPIPPNELLEKKDGERLDSGTKSEAGSVDTAMATLEEVERTKNKSG